MLDAYLEHADEQAAPRAPSAAGSVACEVFETPSLQPRTRSLSGRMSPPLAQRVLDAGPCGRDPASLDYSGVHATLDALLVQRDGVDAASPHVPASYGAWQAGTATSSAVQPIGLFRAMRERQQHLGLQPVTTALQQHLQQAQRVREEEKRRRLQALADSKEATARRQRSLAELQAARDQFTSPACGQAVSPTGAHERRSSSGCRDGSRSSAAPGPRDNRSVPVPYQPPQAAQQQQQQQAATAARLQLALLSAMSGTAGSGSGNTMAQPYSALQRLAAGEPLPGSSSSCGARAGGAPHAAAQSAAVLAVHQSIQELQHFKMQMAQVQAAQMIAPCAPGSRAGGQAQWQGVLPVAPRQGGLPVLGFPTRSRAGAGPSFQAPPVRAWQAATGRVPHVWQHARGGLPRRPQTAGAQLGGPSGVAAGAPRSSSPTPAAFGAAAAEAAEMRRSSVWAARKCSSLPGSPVARRSRSQQQSQRRQRAVPPPSPTTQRILVYARRRGYSSQVRACACTAAQVCVYACDAGGGRAMVCMEPAPDAAAG